jgi:hypothetical protein
MSIDLNQPNLLAVGCQYFKCEAQLLYQTQKKQICEQKVTPWSTAELPDGLFSNQKSKFGSILEGLAMEDVGIFYGLLVHLLVFC